MTFIQPESGEIREVPHGHCWAALHYGVLIPILRRDWYYTRIYAAVYLIIIFLLEWIKNTFHLPYKHFAIYYPLFLPGIYMLFYYNRQYRTRLSKLGYRAIFDPPDYNREKIVPHLVAGELSALKKLQDKKVISKSEYQKRKDILLGVVDSKE